MASFPTLFTVPGRFERPPLSSALGPGTGVSDVLADVLLPGVASTVPQLPRTTFAWVAVPPVARQCQVQGLQPQDGGCGFLCRHLPTLIISSAVPTASVLERHFYKLPKRRNGLVESLERTDREVGAAWRVRCASALFDYLPYFGL